MSKDIRSFFQPKKLPHKQEIDDDDVIPESPNVQIKKKKKENRKKRVLSDDSDEEIFSKKTKLSNSDNKQLGTKKKAKSPPKKVLKEVKATDIFGSTPIKRTEPLVKKQKKETEVGIHSDDEFEKSLMEIDELKEVAMNGNHKSNINDNNHVETISEVSKNKINKEKSPNKYNHDSELTKINYDSNADKKKSDKNRSKASKSGISKDLFAEFTQSDSIKDNCKMTNAGDNKKLHNSTVISDVSKHHNKSLTDNEPTIIEDSDDGETKNKKRKTNKSLNESALTDEERHERKMYSAQLYQKYLNRSGPKHLGAKQIPEGSPDCLNNCAFLLTGVLDSFEREEVTDAITKFGGCIKNSISKKVTHVLAGDDAGPAKMARARDLGIKIISENEFLQMIVDLSKKRSDNSLEVKTEEKKGKSPSRKLTKEEKNVKDINDKSKDNKKSQNRFKEVTKLRHKDDLKCEKSPSQIKIHVKTERLENHDKKYNSPRKCKYKDNFDNDANSELKIDLENKIKQEPNDKDTTDSKLNENRSSSLMWVEKYKPQNIKQIIGQHGDASNVKKLMNWLSKWYVSRKSKTPKPSPWAKSNDGAFYKAALLSGPPGVGKTTTVALVCKELGFDMVEFNASDTRNKTLIKEQIGELLTTTSLSAFAKGDTGKQAVTKKHVLVMDEVDGMAGNEDRGGLQELIALIKSTAVPIICMCNDRNSTKMRSLLNYCYELKFSRPRVDQIKSAMLSICFKEGIKVPVDALTRLIVAAGQDVRQTLNMLSLWAAATGAAQLQRDANATTKDIKLGPWEAVRKVFTAEEHKKMSIHDKSDLFFYDYSLAPLFVQENYLQVVPHCPKNELLERISRAADSISLGDLVEARIRRNQSWGLLPMQAMYSSVMPGHVMAGHVAGQIQFPGWLGKNSRRNKMHRLCQEIHAHTRLSTTGSKSSIFLDYSTYLRDAIVNPLIKDKNDGIGRSIEVLESYHLLREDLESLIELSLWPGQRNPMILIDPKVKAAMTRTYNKSASALPYAPGAVRRGRPLLARGRAGDEPDTDTDADSGCGHEDDYSDDSDPENDALIKKKKTKETDKAGSSKEKNAAKAGPSKEKTTSHKGKKK